jgi:photosystem I reaction center subunit XII
MIYDSQVYTALAIAVVAALLAIRLGATLNNA